MNPARLAIAVLALLSAGGCTIDKTRPSACTDDTNCGGGELCFPEGCGAPDKKIVIEVIANTRSGHHAQDFAVTNLAVTQNIEVYPPTPLVGDVQQRVFSVQNVNATASYNYPVTVRAVGESVLIPGITRQYEASFTSLERGAYSMFVGAGKYTVTATATSDTSIPADSHQNLTVVPGTQANLGFVFQSAETSVSLAAVLVKTRGIAQERDTLLTAKMEVQAFDPITKRALSQRTPVTRADGSFVVWMDPAVEKLGSFTLLVTPSDQSIPTPTKVFVLSQPLPAQLVLEMGSFGQSLPGLTGTLLDDAKHPVAGANVFIEGTVGGGGTYRTRTVTSDDLGVFRVEAFVSGTEGSFTLTAIPPASSKAGIFRGPVKVQSQGIEASLSPNTFACPSRVMVSGTLLRPDGTPAAMAQVVAEPIGPMDGATLPPSSVRGFTDDQGHFGLALDPAEYRFDFLPGEGLPRRSRIYPVRAPASRGEVAGGAIELSDFRLWKGRSISGSITSPQQPLVTSNITVPNASVRFFHVAPLGGKDIATLLAETVADEYGNYKVVLPVAPTAP
ncbi:MAG: carboxypeptidase-like regulatory domain-containing protein [Myxococcaceae bacterium]